MTTDNRGVTEEVFSTPIDVQELVQAAADATIALLNWTYYQQDVLRLARKQLLRDEQTPDVRNIVARIDLALAGKKAIH